MRIGISALLLTSDAGYRKAGICRYIYMVVDRMLAQPTEHDYILFVPEDTTIPDSWSKHPKVTRVSVPFQGRLKRILWEHTRAKSLVREHKLDVWFSTAQSVPFPCGCPRSVMIHDLIPIFFPQYFTREKAIYQKLALRYAMKHAESILANSETTKNDILSYAHIPGLEKRITVTPLGPGNELAPCECETQEKAVLKRLGIPFERYFFTLGTLEPRKNLPALFEAMSIAAAQGELEGVGLVVGGGKGWLDGPIGERLRELKIEDRVHFPGYIDDADLPALFGCSEAFVFPSLYEGFGMPVLEAMLMGVPILAARRAAMEEVGGPVPQFFDPEQPSDIAEKLIAFVKSPEGREERIAEGFERAKSFTWERCAELTLKALESAGSANH